MGGAGIPTDYTLKGCDQVIILHLHMIFEIIFFPDQRQCFFFLFLSLGKYIIECSVNLYCKRNYNLYFKCNVNSHISQHFTDFMLSFTGDFHKCMFTDVYKYKHR